MELAREAGVDELWFEKTVSPFYGLPWRSHLGFNRDLGVDHGYARHVILRDAPASAVEPSAALLPNGIVVGLRLLRPPPPTDKGGEASTALRPTRT